MKRLDRLRRCVVVPLATVLVSGCYDGLRGGIDGALGDESSAGADGGEGGHDDDVDPQSLDASTIPLRRLTPVQYRNTMRDLFGDPELAPTYDDDDLLPTQRGVRQLRADAELALSRRDAWTAPVFPCDITGPADASCAEAFLDDFGRRAFRRPLTEAERQSLMGVYEGAVGAYGFRDAMEVLLSTLLQSPAFLYFIEVGEPIEGAPADMRRLTDWELASRLSYFLWDTLPDDALFEAAARGELGSSDALRAQVERMLESPRGREKVQGFVSRWLQLDGGRLHFSLEETSKDAELFPEYGPALQEAMRIELEAFVDSVFQDGDAKFSRFLTDTRAYVNGPLADLYGVHDGPIDASTWAWVDLDPAERPGLLTRAAYLTVFASADVHSPIRRGVHVIEQMLCMHMGEPPPDADDTPVNGGEKEGEDGETELLSVREDVIRRTEGVQCMTCHGLINPIGFAFEHYDAIGRWQDEELLTGLPIDASGELTVGDTKGPVADAAEMIERLAASRMVRECFAEQWMVEAVGQRPGPRDRDAFRQVVDRFDASDDVREMIADIVLSTSFRYLARGEQD